MSLFIPFHSFTYKAPILFWGLLLFFMSNIIPVPQLTFLGIPEAAARGGGSGASDYEKKARQKLEDIWDKYDKEGVDNAIRQLSTQISRYSTHNAQFGNLIRQLTPSEDLQKDYDFIIEFLNGKHQLPELPEDVDEDIDTQLDTHASTVKKQWGSIEEKRSGYLGINQTLTSIKRDVDNSIGGMRNLAAKAKRYIDEGHFKQALKHAENAETQLHNALSSLGNVKKVATIHFYDVLNEARALLNSLVSAISDFGTLLSDVIKTSYAVLETLYGLAKNSHIPDLIKVAEDIMGSINDSSVGAGIVEAFETCADCIDMFNLSLDLDVDLSIPQPHLPNPLDEFGLGSLSDIEDQFITLVEEVFSDIASACIHNNLTPHLAKIYSNLTDCLGIFFDVKFFYEVFNAVFKMRSLDDFSPLLELIDLGPEQLAEFISQIDEIKFVMDLPNVMKDLMDLPEFINIQDQAVGIAQEYTQMILDQKINFRDLLSLNPPMQCLANGVMNTINGTDSAQMNGLLGQSGPIDMMSIAEIKEQAQRPYQLDRQAACEQSPLDLVCHPLDLTGVAEEDRGDFMNSMLLQSKNLNTLVMDAWFTVYRANELEILQQEIKRLKASIESKKEERHADDVSREKKKHLKTEIAMLRHYRDELKELRDTVLAAQGYDEQVQILRQEISELNRRISDSKPEEDDVPMHKKELIEEELATMHSARNALEEEVEAVLAEQDNMNTEELVKANAILEVLLKYAAGEQASTKMEQSLAEQGKTFQHVLDCIEDEYKTKPTEFYPYIVGNDILNGRRGAFVISDTGVITGIGDVLSDTNVLLLDTGSPQSLILLNETLFPEGMIDDGADTLIIGESGGNDGGDDSSEGGDMIDISLSPVARVYHEELGHKMVTSAWQCAGLSLLEYSDFGDSGARFELALRSFDVEDEVENIENNLTVFSPYEHWDEGVTVHFSDGSTGTMYSNLGYMNALLGKTAISDDADLFFTIPPLAYRINLALGVTRDKLDQIKQEFEGHEIVQEIRADEEVGNYLYDITQNISQTHLVEPEIATQLNNIASLENRYADTTEALSYLTSDARRYDDYSSLLGQSQQMLAGYRTYLQHIENFEDYENAQIQAAAINDYREFIAEFNFQSYGIQQQFQDDMAANARELETQYLAAISDVSKPFLGQEFTFDVVFQPIRKYTCDDFKAEFESRLSTSQRNVIESDGCGTVTAFDFNFVLGWESKAREDITATKIEQAINKQFVRVDNGNGGNGGNGGTFWDALKMPFSVAKRYGEAEFIAPFPRIELSQRITSYKVYPDEQVSWKRINNSSIDAWKTMHDPVLSSSSMILTGGVGTFEVPVDTRYLTQVWSSLLPNKVIAMPLLVAGVSQTVNHSGPHKNAHQRFWGHVAATQIPAMVIGAVVMAILEFGFEFIKQEVRTDNIYTAAERTLRHVIGTEGGRNDLFSKMIFGAHFGGYAAILFPQPDYVDKSAVVGGLARLITQTNLLTAWSKWSDKMVKFKNEVNGFFQDTSIGSVYLSADPSYVPSFGVNMAVQ